MLSPTQPYAAVEAISYEPWLAKQVVVSVLRLDQFFPQLSGNKYFKLKHNLSHAQAQGYSRVISFGGAYSNHIHALAYAAQQYGMQALGIIRGDHGYAANPTLSDAQAWGMQLQFVSRSEYKRRAEPEYVRSLQQQYPDAWVIPEGGSNALAVQGCAEIAEHIRQGLGDNFDTVLLPCGTGATLAGVAMGLPPSKQVLGVAVLKGEGYLEAEVQRYLAQVANNSHAKWQICHDYHGGGYAKCDVALARFINNFPIALEPVYSGKLFFALDAMINSAAIAPGSRIVLIHTGGMQGLRGMQAIMDKRLAAAD
ncbi:pyridoxal-phosphate dependent enzyme [Dasania sp. GY-MA-18]|uniref:Pyridoxal-phosphate dependent enzyme n=1 Tax=Dasania phycosphaerae TaxID=2950436 RepID=A0A9J6RRV2_9GAMM|nr:MULTISPECIES: pyridoxal-phosphate dependent enzyme [Dasania]MCR8924243.1 pyridoxal-phosphate dependent enzyme [Dasania sp. GY-MA-18]MCZ0866896.1 pyridoxal-phosphate dependent enzyme [Dasania phycosphaerae]MCZ0870400.1 pyridoxal-phosphate dependent enzyme [Dasania phycosphaerae]